MRQRTTTPSSTTPPRAFPALETLPASRWRPGGPADPASAAELTPRDAGAGVHLGWDRTGRSVVLPLGGPTGTRVGVLGESLFGRVLAGRLVAVGVRVTATTRGPVVWAALGEAAGDRLTVESGHVPWPSRPPQPVGTDDGPQALVSDLRRPPPVSAGDRRWCTAVHIRREAPRRGRFWRSLDVLMALGADFAEAVAPVSGEQAAQVTASLAPGEVALFRDGGAWVLRPDVSPVEAAMLTPG